MTNPMQDALDYLDGGRKWRKGNFGSPGAERCVMGAMMSAHAFVRGYAILRSIIEEQYPDRLNFKELDGIPSFNDHPHTTWADVERVMEKAVAAWDEQI